MTAPIAIELVANPPPGAEASRALLDACSDAAGPGGCVLGRSADDVPPRALVVVTFVDGTARLRVEIAGESTEGAAHVARETVFRESDPVRERFRAAGLIAAGLVTGADATVAEPADRPSVTPPQPTTAQLPARLGAALVRASGGIGWTSERPWAYAELGADFIVARPLGVSLSGGYGKTVSRDAAGIAEQRISFGAGPGFFVPLIRGQLELSARVEAELQQVRADVIQPSTDRQDDGGRTLVDVGAEVELAVPVAGGVGVTLGDRIDFWGSRTTVYVAGRPAEAIGSWLDTATVGLNVRLP